MRSSQKPLLTLVSYNIHHGEGMDRRINLMRIAGVIRDAGADVACLQEVDCHVLRSRRAHQPRDLARLCGMKAVFSPTLQWPFGARFGNLVLAKLPLEAVATYILPGKGERRGLIEARLRTEQGIVAVFCTHWGLSDAEREEQAFRAVEIVAKSGVPSLLAGDLNEGPDGPAHAILKDAGLAPLGPNAATFPAGDPTSAIDHVYGTPGWRALDAYTMPSLASDHQPVIVELSLAL